MCILDKFTFISKRCKLGSLRQKDTLSISNNSQIFTVDSFFHLKKPMVLEMVVPLSQGESKMKLKASERKEMFKE